jgi:acetyl-CoA carboxylase biotin carboxylase subunit
VRWDAGVDVGTQISHHYDPMLGKLIVWSHDRSSAVARMQRALRELAIVGVDTSREFHLCVTSDPDFVAGKVDVQWLERSLPRLLAVEPDPDLASAAAVAAVLLSHGRAPGVAAGSAAGPRGPSSGGLLLPPDGWPRPAWRSMDQVYGE